uniref:Uncharacterized protein n=1 Tax=Anguilla anguilla TaxID=7936 RepID=A0A0E9TBP3_ANGAN
MNTSSTSRLFQVHPQGKQSGWTYQNLYKLIRVSYLSPAKHLLCGVNF